MTQFACGIKTRDSCVVEYRRETVEAINKASPYFGMSIVELKNRRKKIKTTLNDKS